VYLRNFYFLPPVRCPCALQEEADAAHPERASGAKRVRNPSIFPMMMTFITQRGESQIFPTPSIHVLRCALFIHKSNEGPLDRNSFRLISSLDGLWERGTFDPVSLSHPLGQVHTGMSCLSAPGAVLDPPKRGWLPGPILMRQR
jgi:hypothetical protein